MQSFIVQNCNERRREFKEYTKNYGHTKTETLKKSILYTQKHREIDKCAFHIEIIGRLFAVQRVPVVY